MSRGDIYDVKRALIAVLTKERVTDAMNAALADKPDPTPPDLTHLVTYDYERMTKSQFPMLELLGYQTVYEADTMVKHGRHRIGLRWSVVEPTEQRATRSAELLARATTDIVWDIASGLLSGLFTDVGLDAGPVTVTEEDFSPPMPYPGNAFVKSALVVIELTTYRE